MLGTMRVPFPIVCLLFASTAFAQLPKDSEAKIAATAEQVLHDTGVPSASVAIAQNGRVVYARAFGLARVQPPQPAQAAMAYPIGSVSKQFTATAVLLLQQEGKLKLDDAVAKFFPELTRASEITIRNLLTMTSGYEDYAPQDYIVPAWRKPADPLAIVREWAGKPLDFEPGTQWQYSNTNYVLAALIVQKVTGEPFAQFLRENVIDPLHLPGVFNTYAQSGKLEVTGYVSNAMATPRVLPLEATGWYFGDGDLAMPASTLCLWDLSIMSRTLLKPASYAAMETAYKLKSGASANYGLGMDVRDLNGRRELEHSGEVGGYVAENALFPDDGIAVAVLTNEVASGAASRIAQAIEPLLLPQAPAEKPGTADTFAPRLKAILTGLQAGEIDRALFTVDCNAYFDADTLGDFRSTLAPLGAVTEVTRARSALRGGMTFGLYRVAFSGGETVVVTTYLEPNGKIEQLLVVGKA